MILVSFWNSTIAGGIYGFLSATVIFLLTMAYNEWSRKRIVNEEMLKTFINLNPLLIAVLEDADVNNFDYEKIRSATTNLQILLLKQSELKDSLNELKRINTLTGHEYREFKKEIPSLLKNINRLLIKQRNDIL